MHVLEVVTGVRSRPIEAGEPNILVSLMWAGASMLSLASVIAALYIVKSALRINILPGPSPLHDLLYHFVR